MSQENVEVVRQSLDAYSRRDVDALRSLNHTDMELDWSASRGFQAGVYRGFDEALRFYRKYFAVFDEIRFEPVSFIEVGDSVVVPNVAHQRGRDGIEVTASSALVFTAREHLSTPAYGSLAAFSNGAQGASVNRDHRARDVGSSRGE